MYTVGSMFAGVGGICKGFEQAGFKLVWANERDPHACITYRLNFKHRLDSRDVADTSAAEFEPVDVITSGFPCQAFSIAGRRQGFADDKGRGSLFLHTADYIDRLRPKAFLLENVKNLVSHDQGRTLRAIRNILEGELGYSFIPAVLNSKNFGVPQTRERIYIVGFLGEAGFNEYVPAAEYPCSSAFSMPAGSAVPLRIHHFLQPDRQDEKYYYKKSSPCFDKLGQAVRSCSTVYQWRRTYVRENKSRLCPTLTANMGTGGHNVPIIRDSHGIRKLTPRECFAFQGFYLEDDSFKLPDGMADCHLYKQAGNSVTVPVIKAVAASIKIALDGGAERAVPARCTL